MFNTSITMWSRAPRLGGAFITTLLAAVVVVGLGSWQILRARETTVAGAMQNAQNLSRSLAQHAERTIEGVDITLSAIVDRLEGSADRNDARAYLERRNGALPQTRNLVITDKVGDWIFQSSQHQARLTSADRPYFQWHRDRDAKELHISPRIMSRVGDTDVMAMTRRYNAPDGTFGGVAIGALTLDFLDDLYKTLSIGEKGAIGLWSADGRMIVRRPAAPDSLNKDHSQGPIHRALREKASGVFVGNGSQVDGVARIVAYASLDRYPSLIVSTSLAVDEVLAPWRDEALGQGAIIGIAALALMAIGIGIERRGRQMRLSAQALVRSEELHRLLTENSNDIIAIKPSFGGRSYVSPAARKVLGWEPAELEAMPTHDLVHPDDLERVQAEFASLSQARVVVVSIHRARHKAGHWVQLEAVLQLTAAGTKEQRVILTARDVTARQAAEAALSESEARYRLLAETATDMIILSDLDHVRQYVSPASRDLLGFAPEEMIGTAPQGIVHQDDALLFQDMMSNLSNGSVDRAVSIHRSRRKDGSFVWAEAKARIIRDLATDAPTGIIWAVRDVSDRQKQAQELQVAKEVAEAAANAQGEFLASMSHELRTPLNAIIGFSRLMVDERDLAMPVMQRYARLVQDASTTLLSIVNDVLDVSKLEAGNLDLDPHPFSPRDLVENVGTLLRGQAEGKDLVLHVEADPSLPFALIGDAARLRQVLLNLLSNAVKFTAKGMVWVFVGCESADAGIARVRFAVSDTGIGIPQEKQHRLFKRFSQVDNSTARQFGGTGLGLSICKSLVEVMGGTIVVDSVEGEGTAFWFVLDLPVAEPIAAVEEQNAPDPAAMASSGAHILLAEDVAMNQELAVAMLTKWGHIVDVAPDGAAAVDAVMRTHYDLVLMDIQMPVMDGIEATRRIRGLGGHYATLPIVAMTANVMSRDVALCRESGVDDHIGKPFVPEALRLLVERMTSAREVPTPAPAATGLEADDTVLNAVIFDDIVALMGPARVRSLLVQMQTQLEDDPFSATGSATLRFAAHALVSSSGMLGFCELSQACRVLEQACDSEDNDSARSSIPLAKVRAAVVRVQAYLNNRLKDCNNAQAA